MSCLFVEFTLLNFSIDLSTDFKTSTVYQAIWLNYPQRDQSNFRLLVVEGEAVRFRSPRIYWTKYWLRIGILRQAEFYQLNLGLTIIFNGVLRMVLSVSVLTTSWKFLSYRSTFICSATKSGLGHLLPHLASNSSEVFALRILTAHNLWRHKHAFVHAHIENMVDLPWYWVLSVEKKAIAH